MTNQKQLGEAFWQMNRAALQINEIFSRNPSLVENLRVQRLLVLDADEIRGRMSRIS
jgi:hypothetical protein